jgi:hypothetical protein
VLAGPSLGAPASVAAGAVEPTGGAGAGALVAEATLSDGNGVTELAGSGGSPLSQLPSAAATASSHGGLACDLEVLLRLAICIAAGFTRHSRKSAQLRSFANAQPAPDLSRSGKAGNIGDLGYELQLQPIELPQFRHL